MFWRKSKPVVADEAPADEFAEQFGLDRMAKVPPGFVRNSQGLLYCPHGSTGDGCFTSPGVPKPREFQ